MKDLSAAVYRKSIVTFVDILGFRELIASSSPEDINNIMDAVEQLTRSDHYGPEFEKSFFAFSDCIVRVTPLDSRGNRKYRMGLLAQELRDLLQAQIELAAHGVTLRGGVALGDVSARGNRVFGPALIDAYALESKSALYPRIVVAPALIAAHQRDPLLRAKGRDRNYDLAELRGLLRQGDDGLWFFDYLNCEPECPDAESYLDFLDLHRQLVIEISEEPVAASKALWMARYHNARVHMLKPAVVEALGYSRDSLCVLPSDIPALNPL